MSDVFANQAKPLEAAQVSGIFFVFSDGIGRLQFRNRNSLTASLTSLVVKSIRNMRVSEFVSDMSHYFEIIEHFIAKDVKRVSLTNFIA